MNTTVISISSKSALKDQPQEDSSGREVIWPVKDLPDEARCGLWLDQAVTGTQYEWTATSLWRQYPNMRDAAVKLALVITPKWPTEDGTSLLQKAVFDALARADEKGKQGLSTDGVVIGAYMAGLVDAVKDVACLVVRGRDRSGQVCRWPYFSQPLLEWASGHGMQELIVTKATNRQPKLVLKGLRTHLSAFIMDPTDAGYLAEYGSLE